MDEVDESATGSLNFQEPLRGLLFLPCPLRPLRFAALSARGDWVRDKRLLIGTRCCAAAQVGGATGYPTLDNSGTLREVDRRGA